MSDGSSRGRLDTPRTSRNFTPRVDVEAVGRVSESFARFLGTGRYLAIQTVFVIVWIGLNLFAVGLRWDPYPFILLNLAFSTQAAYAAPLILLAQTRQAERDRVLGIAVQAHRDAQVQGERAFEARQTEMLGRERAMAEQHLALLAQNTVLTEQIARLTTELHTAVCGTRT